MPIRPGLNNYKTMKKPKDKSLSEIKRSSTITPRTMNKNINKLKAANILKRMVNHDIFYRLFVKFFKTRFKFLVMRGASASGKSFSSIKFLIYLLLMERKNAVFFCALKAHTEFHMNNVYSLIKKELEVLSIDLGVDITNVISLNKTYRRITVSIPVNGKLVSNELVFFGLDDSEKLKHLNAENGNGFDFAYVEEANQIDAAKFFEVVNRVRNEGSKIMLAFNPTSKDNWIYEQFFEPTESESLIQLRNISMIHRSTVYDNPHLTRDQVKDRERTAVTAYQKKVYLLGEWASSLGSVIIEGKDFFTVSESEEPMNPNIYKLIGYGLDFGATDSTGLVALYADSRIERNPKYFVKTLIHEPIGDDEILTRRMLSIGIDRDALICADNASKASINYLARTFPNIFGCKKYTDRITDDVSTIKNIKPLMYDDDPLIDELSRVEYVNGVCKIRQHKFSHAFDAFRYSLDNIQMKTKRDIERELRDM